VIELDFETLAEEIGGSLADRAFARALFRGVSIDSRELNKRQLFIAIKGPNTDGHKFIGEAMKKGASGLVVSRGFTGISAVAGRIPIVEVEDTHQSLIRLATSYRLKTKTTIAAITGSNGKTTTKEFVYAVIRKKVPGTYRSPGNLNNLYGLPLSILGMPADSKFGVFELGISLPGEMTRLAGILRPDLGLITNVGPTHLETLETVEKVAEAKLELADAMESGRPILINADDTHLIRAVGKRAFKMITYGVENRADFTARRLGLDRHGYPLVEIDDTRISIPLFGDHQVYNLLAGYAAGNVLGLNVSPRDLTDLDYDFAPYRGQIENAHGLVIIADCYNANPVSMEAGLRSFSRYAGNLQNQNRRSIAVIGDMLELGPRSAEFHREIGLLLLSLEIEIIFTVGPASSDIYHAALEKGFDEDKIRHFSGVDNAASGLLELIKKDDIIYFKASRGVGLEKIITLLKGAAFRQN
jgi:UDP-N-acetylmuramoyl-tripeptide--D-alanyl-D-alanine ligase